MHTPHSAILGPPSDKEMVIVVCTDEDGNTVNHYLRDRALRDSLAAELAPPVVEVLDAPLRAERAMVAEVLEVAPPVSPLVATILQRATDEITAQRIARLTPTREVL